jgi:hypothetical protein
MSWWSYRTTPLEALLRGRRRRIVKSSTTRLAVDVSDAKSLLGRRLGGLLFMLIGLGLAWLARRRERHHRRQALALESAAVSTIRDSQTVLRGQISDPLTGATQAGAPPMPTPIVAHAVPVAEAVPAMAVPVQTCPAGGHPLSSYSTQTVGHGCDVCGRQIAVAEQIWRCASCNYDKCSACAAVWAAPPQPSAPPAAAVPSGYDAMQQQQKQKQQQQQQQHPERPPPPDYATATAPPFSAVPQPQQQQVHAQQYGQPATAHAVPASAAANPNIPMATAWAAPAAPIPTNGQTAPMFNPAWAGGAVDRVFVHLKGWIWAPDARLVRAPFTGEAVIAYHSRVTQEYQVLVKYTHRRKIKSGRRKGSKGKDDPGSDSEYEEEQRTRWENRTRTVWSDKNAVETLYIEDETGRVRFCPSKGGYPTPEENGSWAIGFGEGAFRDYQVDLPVCTLYHISPHHLILLRSSTQRSSNSRPLQALHVAVARVVMV